MTQSPRLLVQLKRGSYFTLRPQTQPLSSFVPEWYAGNIYDMERAQSRVVPLPENPSLVEPTSYDVFISGDYEVFSSFMFLYSLSLTFPDQDLWRPRGPEIWNSSSNTKLPCPSPVRRCFLYVSSLANCNMWLHRWLCLWRSNRDWDSRYRGLVDCHRGWPTKRIKGSSSTQCFLC